MSRLPFPTPIGATDPIFASRTAQVLRVPDANEKTVDSYCADLTASGFSLIAENRLPGGHFFTYTDGITKLSVSFLLRQKEMRIFFEPFQPAHRLASMGSHLYDQVTLTQYCTHTSRSTVTSTGSGMGYILRRTDGQLIVVDGGYHSAPDYADDYPTFRDLLWELSDGRKPHVALWILTHPHSDHFEVLTKMTEEDATIDAYLSTLVKKGETYSHFAEDMAARIPHYEEKNLSVHTGDRLDLGDMLLEVYTCPEELELYDRNALLGTDGNDQSLIFALHIGAQKVLFTGDAYRAAADQALAVAGGAIRADICQIHHHGRTNRRDDPFYSLVAPKVALWPGCYAQIDKDGLRGANGWILGPHSSVLDHYVAFDGTVTISFPYTCQNRPYRSPRPIR